MLTVREEAVQRLGGPVVDGLLRKLGPWILDIVLKWLLTQPQAQRAMLPEHGLVQHYIAQMLLANEDAIVSVVDAEVRTLIKAAAVAIDV